jgi:glycosyltransferase involved in cell wall biosynthesis
MTSRDPVVSASHRVRLAYLVSHPIQYQAPLLRRLAHEPDIDLTVFFASDFSVRGYRDEGFGVAVQWDVPLLEGYRHVFLPRLRDGNDVSATKPMNRGILRALRGSGAQAAFDVLWVHGYATVNAIHGMVAAKLLGIPVMLRAESWLRDRGRSAGTLAAKRIFFKGLESLVDAVLPIGTFNAEYWRYYFGDHIPQFLVPYAVDNQYFSERARLAQSTRSELHSELNLDPSRPVILFASKLQERKNCSHLLAAFSRLAASGLDPLPHLVIVGDGEERAALERQAANSGLSTIRFAGFRNQSEMPRFFDLATVFVLPSRHEPWGLIVNEVMNAARPVIVSEDVGCAPDLVQDGVNGFIYPTGDIDSLTAALARVLTSPAIAETMDSQAYRRIQQWGLEQDVQGIRQALQHLVPGFTAGRTWTSVGH